MGDSRRGSLRGTRRVEGVHDGNRLLADAFFEFAVVRVTELAGLMIETDLAQVTEQAPALFGQTLDLLSSPIRGAAGSTAQCLEKSQTPEDGEQQKQHDGRDRCQRDGGLQRYLPSALRPTAAPNRETSARPGRGLGAARMVRRAAEGKGHKPRGARFRIWGLVAIVP